MWKADDKITYRTGKDLQRITTGRILQVFPSGTQMEVLPDRYADKRPESVWSILIGIEQIVSTNLASSVS